MFIQPLIKIDSFIFFLSEILKVKIKLSLLSLRSIYAAHNVNSLEN